MHTKGRFPNLHFGASLRPDSAALAILVLLLFLIFVFLFLILTTQPAQAQTYSVIYNFTGGLDGGNPFAGLTIDTNGDLYGTTCGTICYGGNNNHGTVFRLTKVGSSWVFTPLYIFRGGDDGDGPAARIVIGSDGSLYGTTSSGGQAGCGTVFKLTTPANTPPKVIGGWTKSTLYQFTGNGDGCVPTGDLILDRAGNMYGTTVGGGTEMACGGNGCGTVFQLTRSGSGWTETLLHSFNRDDGEQPLYSGVMFDAAGNLYGTTVYGGPLGCSYGPCGNAFQLTPSGSGWTENALHNFQGLSDGAQPVGGLVSDQHGVLYGTTAARGTRGGGTVFQIWQGGGGQFSVLYSFPGNDFDGPRAGLSIDTAGNLYGTTYASGAHNQGSAFKLVSGCGGFTYASLHDFAAGPDGGSPISSLIWDANGNIFGTTSEGGAYGHGVVFEITPEEDSKIAPTDSSGCASDR